MEKQIGIRFGIRKKTLVYFLILSLVPLVIGGTISYIITRNILKENARIHLTYLTMDCGRKISYYISARYQDIKLLSRSDVFKSKDTNAKQKYIEEIMEAYPGYKAISVIDLDGKIISCTLKELVGKSRADREWFQRTIQCKQGEVITLGAYRAETAGWDMVLGFNSPLTDANNKEVIGVLNTRMSMDYIIDRIQILDERIPSVNNTYLLNKKGDILAGPEKSKSLTTYHLYEFPVIMDLLAGKTGIREYKNDRGEKVITAWYVLKGEGDFDGWDWGIISTEPASEAYKAAHTIINILVLLVLVIMVSVIIFALFISRMLSRPIVQLSKSALRIAGGDLKPIEIKHNLNDEIGDLVDAFNKMSEDLHIATVSRDALVKEIANRKQAEKELKKKMHQLERFNKLTVDRELRMIELKKEINELLEQAGLAKKYSTG
jgi:sensor histidine kinase YesM